MNWQERSELITVSAGKKSPDLIIEDGTLVNVYTGELLENYSIGICKERIAFVSTEKVDPGSDVKIIRAKGKFIIPGFIDSHNHLDAFCTIPEYVKYLIPDGTTTVISESSAIANAMGYQGILWFLESSKGQPIKIYVTAPPTVPGNPELQASHRIGIVEIEKLLDLPEVVGVGESYWTRVLQGDTDLLQFVTAAISRGKIAEGHGAGARKLNLNAFAASGISSCHEAINAADAKARLRLGLKTVIRDGAIRKDLEAVASIAKEPLDFRNLSLCSDGIDPWYLVNKGCMLPAIQKAIDLGFEPVTAIQMATINNAQRFGLEHSLGGIAPGKYADMIITPSLTQLTPECIISNGRIIFRQGKALVNPRPYSYPPEARRILRFSKVDPQELKLAIADQRPVVTGTVIHQETAMLTRERQLQFKVVNNELLLEADILKVVAISTLYPERKTIGLLSGFGLKNGACASTYTWDTANLMAVGDNDQDLALAINRVGELGGGLVLCSAGKIIAEIPLPIGGLITTEKLEGFASMFSKLTNETRRLGCLHHDPFLSLEVLTFVGVPHLRICDRGLISIRENKFIPVLHIS